MFTRVKEVVITAYGSVCDITSFIFWLWDAWHYNHQKEKEQKEWDDFYSENKQEPPSAEERE